MEMLVFTKGRLEIIYAEKEVVADFLSVKIKVQLISDILPWKRDNSFASKMP